MKRLLGIVLVIGSLVVFLEMHTRGVEHAFGGAFARFAHGAPAPHVMAEPAAPQRGPDWWEHEEHAAPQGIAQGVRERVNQAMETGARRNGGG